MEKNIMITAVTVPGFPTVLIPKGKGPVNGANLLNAVTKAPQKIIEMTPDLKKILNEIGIPTTGEHVTVQELDALA